MKDILFIINAEKRTLLRGFLVCFLFIFPFTFLPILGDGLSWENIKKRFPDSTLYTVGLSLVVVISAVVHNYNNLVERKRHFDKPAFTKLDFYGRMDGVGSIVHELETFLLGKLGEYYFRINLVNPDQKSIEIEIVPLINLEENKELKTILIKELGFKQNIFLGQIIKTTQADLKDENFLLSRLLNLENELKKRGAQSLDIDENTLEIR